VGRATARRSLRWRDRIALPQLRLRLPGRRVRLALAVLAAVAGVLAAAWLWVRDSSLVAVERVSVSGQSGPDAAAIRSALISAARSMTTLDIQMSRLHTAVSPFPEVKDVRVATEFPHGMRIRVIEQLPVAVVEVDGRRVAVAGDGTILHNFATSATLPSIQLSVPPGGPRVTEPTAMKAVTLLAAAPYRMLAKISEVAAVAPHGLVAQLRNGPSIYFGDNSQLGAKWTAAVAVLADSGSAGASYIDVTDPARPAAGAGGGGAAGAAGGVGGAGSAATGAAQTTTAGTAGTSTTAASTAATATTTPTGG
jgi:cell division protein FtsQ